MFCNNQDAGLVNLAYKVDDVRGELDSNRLLPFPQTPSLTKMITSVSVAGLLTAGMIAADRYRHFNCFLSASHILQYRISAYITPYLILNAGVWCILVRCILHSCRAEKQDNRLVWILVQVNILVWIKMFGSILGDTFLQTPQLRILNKNDGFFWLPLVLIFLVLKVIIRFI